MFRDIPGFIQLDDRPFIVGAPENNPDHGAVHILELLLTPIQTFKLEIRRLFAQGEKLHVNIESRVFRGEEDYGGQGEKQRQGKIPPSQHFRCACIHERSIDGIVKKAKHAIFGNQIFSQRLLWARNPLSGDVSVLSFRLERSGMEESLCPATSPYCHSDWNEVEWRNPFVRQAARRFEGFLKLRFSPVEKTRAAKGKELRFGVDQSAFSSLSPF